MSRRIEFSFLVGESFPALEDRLKSRYLRELVQSRTWPGGAKQVAEACGLSPPTVRNLCIKYEIPIPEYQHPRRSK